MFSPFARRHRPCSSSYPQRAGATESAAEDSREDPGPAHGSPPSATPGRVGLPDTSRCPVGPDAAYRLVYNDPEDPLVEHPVGWAVSASQGAVGCWSAALTAHGAGTLAGPRQAKAAAVRALHDRGVLVDDWDTDVDAAPTRVSYRARVRSTRLGPDEP